MKKFNNKYRIEPNRAQWWDYSTPGRYFITICIINRKHILGNIKNKKMYLSEYGNIVKSEFIKIPEYHKRIILDEWVIMPNHVHCIIQLGNMNYDNKKNINNDGDGGGNVDDTVDKIHEFYLQYQQQKRQRQPSQLEIKKYRALRRKMIIPKILGKFQMQTSKQINIVRKTRIVKNTPNLIFCDLLIMAFTPKSILWTFCFLSIL